MRKPFQGLTNIVRFNWHYYALSAGCFLSVILLGNLIGRPYSTLGYFAFIAYIILVVVSLSVSFYVYDLSDLYKLQWLDEMAVMPEDTVVNINAGFDEFSALLIDKFPASRLLVYDFYDPLKHTEVSIKRARKAYPPYSGTQQITTSVLPVDDDFASYIFLILSAHEIRNDNERNTFFFELKRVLKTDGKLIIIEHLRDITNFWAYNIGFFHFIKRSSWNKTFKMAGLNINREVKLTPFVTIFILEKNAINR